MRFLIRWRRLVFLTSVICILSMVMISGIALAGEIPPSSEFEKNIGELGTWAPSNASINGLEVTMPTADNSRADGYAFAYYELTDADLLRAIDNYSISINTSASIAVSDFSGSENVDLNLMIKCGETFNGAYNAAPLIKEQQNVTSTTSFSLFGNGVIPAGTRYIIVEVRYDQTSVSIPYNSIVFSNINATIKDTADPVLISSYDTDWTNQPVEVTLNASDASGIKGIYDSSGLLTSNDTYTFTVNASGVDYTFYALDNANRQCDDLVVSLDNIDTDTPSFGTAPILSHTDWTNEDITITLDARNPAAGQSPEVYEYSIDGGSYVELAGNVLTVTNQGEHTYSIRVKDEAGNVGAPQSVTTRYDNINPTMSAELERVPGENRYSIIASDDDSGIDVIKYDIGIKDEAYFVNDGDVVASGEIFHNDYANYYTIYSRDKAGNVSLEVHNKANIIPSIDSIADVSTNEDTPIAISITTTDADDSSLNVAVTSDTPDVIANFTGSPTELVINPEPNMHGDDVELTVTVSDGEDSTTTSFFVDVISVNDVPDAADFAESTLENNTLYISPLDHVTDGDMDSITLVDAQLTTSNGSSILINGDEIVYSPVQYFCGEETIEYSVTDGVITTPVTGTITVTVTNVNQAPVAVNDSAQTCEDTEVTVDVLDNDIDYDLLYPAITNEELTISVISDPAHGSYVIDDNKIVYTPDLNYSGNDNLTYEVSDGEETDSEIVHFMISPVNDVPSITNISETSMTVLEDSVDNALTFTISDLESDIADLEVYAASTNSEKIISTGINVVSIDNATGNVLVHIDPKHDAYGMGQIKIVVSDGNKTAEALIDVQITSVNDKPISVDDDMTIEWNPLYEDVEYTFDLADLLLNDTDVENDTLFVVTVTTVSHGTFTRVTDYAVDATDNRFIYTPESGYNGTVTAQYEVSDGNLQDTGSFTFELLPVDDAPSFVFDGGSVYVCDEDDINVSDIVIHVSDIDTSASDITVSASSSNESLLSSQDITIVRNASDEWQFEISMDFAAHAYGTTNIIITVSDGHSEYSLTQEYTVISQPDAPIANDVTYRAVVGSRNFFIPTYNDLDHDDNDIVDVELFIPDTAGSLTAPTGGTAQVLYDADGYRGVDYIAPDEVGTYYFDYTVSDGTLTDTATVTVEVVLDDTIGPYFEAIADMFLTENDIIPAFDIDIGGFNDIVSVEVVSSNQDIMLSANQTAVQNVGRNYLIYLMLEANKVGTSIITITATDSENLTYSRQFYVYVNAYNNLPVVVADSLSAVEDTTMVFTANDLLSNDTDADSDSLIIDNVIDPAHGYIVFDGANYTYHPDPNYYGTDTFTYRISDGTGFSDYGTVSIEVAPVNDRPDGDTDYVTLQNVTGNESIDINVVSNDDDPDPDTLFVSRIASQPSYGTAVINADGTIKYTRNGLSPEQHGRDSFTYYVIDRDPDLSDPEALEELTPTTVIIQYDWTPNFGTEGQSRRIDEDNAQISIRLNVWYNTSYPNIASLMFGSVYFVNDHGSQIIPRIENAGTQNPEFWIDYTVVSDFSGSERIYYEIYDPVADETRAANVNITVIPDNDPPYFVESPETDWEINEDGTKTLTVTFADVDNDNATLEFNAKIENHDDADSPAMISEDMNVVIGTDGSGNATATITMPAVPERSGSFDIVYEVSDGIDTTTVTTRGTVLPVDDATVAQDIEEDIYEDTVVTIDLADYVSDIDTAIADMTFSITDPSHGSATLSGSEITFLPERNNYSTATMTYTVSSGTAPDVTKTITFLITPVNDYPYVYDIVGYVASDEDEAIRIDFSSYDVEDGYDITFSFSGTSGVVDTNGTLVDTSKITIEGTGEDRTIVFTPEENMFGAGRLEMTATDKEGGTKDVVIDLDIQPVNDLPTAKDDAGTTDEDTSVTINLINNDEDVEAEADPINDALKIASIDNITPGAIVTNNLDGTVTYAPPLNYNGSDSFTYTIVDSGNATSSATVNVTINPVNDPPVAKNDSVTTNEDTAVTITTALDNDTDLENDELFINDSLVWDTSEDGLAADIVVSADGKSITYTPKDNVSGIDTFTYTVNDGHVGGDSTPATITVEIFPTNDEPTLEPITPFKWEFDEDGSGTFEIRVGDAESPLSSLVVSGTSGDTDIIEDEDIVITTGSSSDIRNVQLSSVPDANGELNITLTLSDGEDETILIAPVYVRPVNDAPTIDGENILVNEDDSVSSSVLGVDKEKTSDLLVHSLDGLNAPAHGVAVVNADGSYTYTPTANYSGTDSFRIIVDDEDGGTAYCIINVTIIAQDDPVVAVDDTGTTPEDIPVSVDVLVNDTDEDEAYGDTKTIQSIDTSALEHGTVIIDPNDSDNILFTPAPNNNKDVEFEYTVVDSQGNTDTAKVNIIVTAVDDSPTDGDNEPVDAGEDVYDIFEDDASALFDVLANDSVDHDPSLTDDPITETLTIVSIQNGPSHAAECFIDNGQIRYQPAPDYFGTDTLEYIMQDNTSSTDVVVSVTFNVQPINDLPIISDMPNVGSIGEDTVVTRDFTISDVDDVLDIDSLSFVTNNDDLVESITITENTATPETNDYIISVDPTDNMQGSVVITVTVDDTHPGGTANDSFGIIYTAVNDLPVPTNDFAETDENTPIFIDVLGNDDVDLLFEGDELSVVNSINDHGNVFSGVYEIVTLTAGSEVLDGNGNTVTMTEDRPGIKYTPDADWTSSTTQVITLTYEMREDGEVPTYIADLIITVNPVNDAPTITIVPATRSLDEDTANTGDFTAVIWDEEDAKDELIVTHVSTVNDPANPTSGDVLGDVVFNGSDASDDRLFNAPINANINGSATITLRVTDSEGLSCVTDAQTVVTINNTNDNPSPQPDVARTDENTPIYIDVLGNDDVDLHFEGDELEIVVDTNVGTETPVVVGGSIWGTVSVVSLPAGSSVINSDGTEGTLPVGRDVLYFTPNKDWNSTISHDITLTYHMREQGTTDSYSTNVTVTVDPVNDAPVLYIDPWNETLSHPEAQDYINLIMYADDEDDINDVLSVSADSSNFLIVAPSGISIVYEGTQPDGIHAGKARYNVTISPFDKFNGTTTMTFTVSDDDGLYYVDADLAAVTDSREYVDYTTTAVNDPPVAHDDPNLSADEGETKNLDVLANDTDDDIRVDPDSDKLHIVVDATYQIEYLGDSNNSTTDEMGTLTKVTVDGVDYIEYSPNAGYEDFNGTIDFRYTITDNAGSTFSTADAKLTINQVNDAPVANDATTVTVDEDNNATIDLSPLISDVDMIAELNLTPLDESIEIETTFIGVDNGTATLQADGTTVVFDPIDEYHGTETFSYTLNDGHSGSDTGLITVQVNEVNDPPLAVADANLEVDEGNNVNLYVLSNDTDADITYDASEDELYITNVTYIGDSNNSTSTSMGAFTVAGSAGAEYVVYTHDAVNFADFNGTINFSYTITDRFGHDNPTHADAVFSTVNNVLTVNQINDAPVAVNDIYGSAIMEGSGAVSYDVIANDSDVDMTDDLNIHDENESIKAVNPTLAKPAMGTVVVSGANDEQLTFTPAENASGTVVITYYVQDVSGAQAAATLTIEITDVEDPPVAVDDARDVVEDATNFVVTVLDNDYDVDCDGDYNTSPDSEILIQSINQTQVTNGTAVISADKRTIIYTPDADFDGVEEFNYTIVDADGLTATAKVTLTIDAQNDAPEADDESYSLDEDTHIDIDMDDAVNGIIRDADTGDTLTVAIETDCAHGTTSYDAATKVLTYTPDADYHGADSIYYSVTDSENATSYGTISLTVLPVNDPPVAVVDTGLEVNEGNNANLDVLANDTDADIDFDGNDELYITNVTYIGDSNDNTITPMGAFTVAGSAGSEYIVYTHDAVNFADFNGTINFSYTITDRFGHDNPTHADAVFSTVNNVLTVNQVNDAPIADDDSVSTSEGTPISIDLSSLIDDVDDDIGINIVPSDESIGVDGTWATAPANGTAVLQADGVTVIYTPGGDFHGSDSFVYTLNDGHGGSDIGTITITVSNVNDPPVAVVDTGLEVNEGNHVNLYVLANDTDADIDFDGNDVLDIISVTYDGDTNDNTTEPMGAFHIVGTVGSEYIEYVADANNPDVDFNGTITFTYMVMDNSGATSSVTNTLTVNQVNDDPVAGDTSAVTGEDTVVNIDLASLISDVDMVDNLNIDTSTENINVSSTFTNLDHGTATIIGTLVTFTPEANWNGVEVFNYTLNDSNGGSTTGEITVTVNADTDPPVAVADAITVSEDSADNVIEVLNNDYDVDTDTSLNATPAGPISLQGFDSSQVVNGTVTIVGNTLEYTPDADFYGTETFDYTIADADGMTATATVTITVDPIGDVPVVDSPDLSLDEDTHIDIDMNNYFTDADPADTFTIAIVTDCEHGTTSYVPATKILTYTPNADYNGEDSIEFSVTDSQGHVVNGVIDLTINQVNDAPVCAADNGSGDEDTPIIVNLLGNDSDIDMDTLLNADPSAEEIKIDPDGFTGVANGTVEISASNAEEIIFTPDEDYNGTVTFTYTTIDNTGDTHTATVTIVINPIDDAPKPTGVQFVLDEDNIGVVHASVFAADPDITPSNPTGDLIVNYEIVSNPVIGTLVMDAMFNITYTPIPDFNGLVTFDMRVTDENGDSRVITVEINVNQVNDAPHAEDDIISMMEDSFANVDILINDNDIDTDRALNANAGAEILNVSIHREPMHGSVEVIVIEKSLLGREIDGTGVNEVQAVRYTPFHDYAGVETFEYTLTDANRSVSIATVTLNITDVPEPNELLFGNPETGDSTSAVSDNWYIYLIMLFAILAGSYSALKLKKKQ